MSNVLNKDKQIAVIGALAEGSTIRSIERITGIHRDTIMRPDNLKQHITVLKIPPVVSPITAVRAAIVQEFKVGTAQEN